MNTEEKEMGRKAHINIKRFETEQIMSQWIKAV